jgi:hypothetical protein
MGLIKSSLAIELGQRIKTNEDNKDGSFEWQGKTYSLKKR